MNRPAARARSSKTARKPRVRWDSETLRALRRHLGLTQQVFAQQLGTRQQTISEWETGLYRPRGSSATLLTMVADQAGFQYSTGSTPPEEEQQAQ